MNVLFIVLFISVFLTTLIVLLTRTKFLSLPGPRLRDYLPKGEVLPMLRDNRLIVRSLLSLSRKYGDVFQVWLGPADTLVTSVPADIVQVLSKTDTFVRPKAMRTMFETAVPGSVFTMTKQQHLAVRGQLRENFNYSSLKDFHSRISEAVEEICQDLTSLVRKAPSDASSDVINLTKLLSMVTFRVITNVAFGFELTREERLLFADYTNEFIGELMLDFVGYPVRQALTIFGVRKHLFESKRRLDQLCQRFIRRRLEETKQQRDSRPKDLLDAIINLKDHDMTAITSQSITFAVAGAHTLYESMAWSIYEICRSPSVAAEIRKELTSLFGARTIQEPVTHEDVDKMSYMKQVWKEALRVHPPGAFLVRTAAQDVTLLGSGVTVPKGANVLAFVAGAHMSPEVWREPERFRPERWDPEVAPGDRVPPGSYTPFSIGPKNCAGQFLADYEAIVILAELYRRFEFSLACDADQVTSCSGWVEGARSCVDGSDFAFGVPVHVKLRV